MDEKEYIKIHTTIKEGEGNTSTAAMACILLRIPRDKKNLQTGIFREEWCACISTLACFLNPETRRQQLSTILQHLNHRLRRKCLVELEQILPPHLDQVANEATRGGTERLLFLVDVVVPLPSPLTAVTYGAGDAVPREDKCPICLEDFRREIELAKMPCTHVFHWRCLSTWLERSSLCPYCRSNIRKESP